MFLAFLNVCVCVFFSVSQEFRGSADRKVFFFLGFLAFFGAKSKDWRVRVSPGGHLRLDAPKPFRAK